MSIRQYECLSFEPLKKGLILLLQDKGYRHNTMNNYRRKLNYLERYMIANDIHYYEPTVGQRFIDDYITWHEISKANRQFIHTVIRRLDDFCVDKYQIQRKTEQTQLPNSYTLLMETYLQKCVEDGNKDLTIIKKRCFLREFYYQINSLGCQDLKNANALIICKACLMQYNHDSWAVIRMFLRYLNFVDLVKQDFSNSIPHYKRAFHLPIIYTEDEINCFEEAI